MRQKSYQSQVEVGTLYLVATPIGNLQDFSMRAQQVLSDVQLIAAEDTRHTRKLLTHLGISIPMVSYHEHNERKQSEHLIKRLQAGESIALVTDAGMPAISDPGEAVVKLAIEHEVPVVPIPGPNAALTALIASGLPAQPHLFIGFLPRTTSKRKKELVTWAQLPVTLMCYEAPHRVIALLTDIIDVLGDRQVAVVRELTKKHEEWLRGSASMCLAHLQEVGPRGEYTVIIAGYAEEASEQDNWWKELTLVAHVDHYIRDGWTKKEAIREVAIARQIPKRDVYQSYHGR